MDSALVFSVWIKILSLQQFCRYNNPYLYLLSGWFATPFVPLAKKRPRYSVMIFLEEHHLISQGEDRRCYVHPEAPDKCIKVTFSQNPVQSQKEAAYYQHLIRRKVSFRRLSRFYGRIPTNNGKGFVFELIRDCDGSISETLLHYLRMDSELLPRIRQDLFHLKNYLVEEGINIRDLKADNFAYRGWTVIPESS